MISSINIKEFTVRKFTVCLLAVLLLLSVSLAGTAESVPALNFVQCGFSAGQKFPVYSAPGTDSWRGSKGKAAVSTNGTVWTAGSINGWILVMYETSKGACRVGYIDGSLPFRNESNAGELDLAHMDVTVTKKCKLTDDPWKRSTSIVTLKKGTHVTFLATFSDLAYIETTVKSKTVRGFVSAEYLDLSGVTAYYASLGDSTYTEDADEQNEENPAVPVDESDEESGTEDVPGGESVPSDSNNSDNNSSDNNSSDNNEETPSANEPSDSTAGDEENGEQPDAYSDPDAQNPSDDSASDSSGESETEVAPGSGDNGPGASSDDSQSGEDSPDTDQNGVPSVLSGDLTVETWDIDRVDVSDPAEPKGGPSSEGESAVSDAGADWYGVCQHYYDDNVIYYIYATDSRGYLKTVSTGYTIEETSRGYNVGSDCTLTAYELPNGDILTCTWLKPSVQGHNYVYTLHRPTETGFATLFSLECFGHSGSGYIYDYRIGKRYAFTMHNPPSEQKIGEWFCGVLDEYFRPWGLTFSMKSAFSTTKNGTLSVPCVDESQAGTFICSKIYRNIPIRADLVEEAEAHFQSEDISVETQLGRVLDELSAAGLPLTQIASENRNDANGQLTSMWKTYSTAGGVSVRFEIGAQTGHIDAVVLTDTELVTRKLPLSVKAIRKLSTPKETVTAYQALVHCSELGLTDPDGMAAFELKGTEDVKTQTELGVRAVLQAGNASVELYRYTWRIGAESFHSSVTITIDGSGT